MNLPSLMRGRAKQIEAFEEPSWWTLGMVVFGAIFALLAIWQILSTDDGEPEPTPLTSSEALAPGNDTTEPSPAVDPDAEQTPDPGNDTLPIDGTPGGGIPGVSGPDADGNVSVPDSDGQPVLIPAGALDLGEAAVEAYFDPTEAVRIPTVDGSPYLPGPDTATDLTITGFEVSSSVADRIAFLAVADADGPAGPGGEQFVSVEVINEDDTWKVQP